MKVLVLAAVIVAVSSGRLTSNNNNDQGERSQWPWETGKLYRYNVDAHTLAHHTEGASSGNSFRARFTVRAKAPGHLQAKLENPQNAQVHQELKQHEPMPEDLKYQSVPNLDKPFEIYHDGGRVLWLSLPSAVPLAQENLLKGLIGALQVDLSTYRNVHSSHDTYDKESQQGLFRKMETDVTGDCETLYAASPAPPEWRREVSSSAEEEDPIEITKSKNYGHCHHRVDYHFGVPQGAEWTGTAHKSGKDQFIKRATVSRILVGKNGPIYKAETTSTVNVHPHLYGKHKAEVHSKVRFQLVSAEQDSEAEWPQPEANRKIPNLLYSLSSQQINIDEDSSSSSGSRESYEKHIQVDKYSRDRRSVRSKSVVSVNKLITRKREQNSGSSSSSESASTYVNDDIPKNNEPAYAALYMNPQPRGDKKQNPMNAQKLVQEMAQQLQNTNNMPKADFLSKFNILVRVISSMSYGQLSQTSRSIEIAKSSNDYIKSDMWMIYRDAVAQAGTSPAFQQIKTWIESKKVQGEEAAEIVAVLVRSLRYPTKETMSQFFELAMNPEVTKQMYLNSTALIAATKFINMGQVNNETAHNYYPSHMYGRLSRKHDNFVVEEILPRLSAQLKLAIDQGDSHKSQVYVKAIGNLGHRATLNVFAPYLEGKTQVSTYLRTRIVENLKVLAQQRDSHVRAVLYSILKNTAEPYEVRVAAIQNIFMGRPSSAMMQTMAQMTKDDPSKHVRSALKSAIESAADLKHPHFYELAKTAEAAKDMLTDEEFGIQYSKKRIHEYNDRDDEYGMMTILSKIGSKDSLFNKAFKYSWKNRIAGWDQESGFGAAFSGRQKFAEYFSGYVLDRNNDKRSAQSNHKYSAEKIAQILNIKNDQGEPLEASFYADFMSQERYFAFTEEDIRNFGVQLGEYLSKIPKGIKTHFTKVVNTNQVYVMFPVASGVPFIFKYREPTLVHIQSSIKGKVDLMNRDNNKDVSLDNDFLFTYATNQDGSVGFLDTLSNQYPSVGLVEKIQFNIPVKLHFAINSGEAKLKLAPREPEQDSTIVHYSVWPYTANQKKDTLVPFSQDPNTKVITRPNKVVSIDYKFGQQVGAPFQLQGYSYANDYRNWNSFVNWNNFLSNIIYALKQKDIAQTHFNFRYLGKQAKSKAVSITAVYDTLYNQNNQGQNQWSPVATEPNDGAPNSPSRREELAKRVTSGIKSARAQVLDLSAQFDSADKLEYALTFALGYSYVDPKTQFAFYAGRNSDQHGPSQLNGAGIITKPSISPMNFQEALNNELKMNFEADIRYNQKENLHIQGSGERSKKYTEELQNHPWGKACKQDSDNNNNYQEECHKAIIMAHAPDNIQFTVTYKDINPMSRDAAYQAYRIAQYLAFWNAEKSHPKNYPEGQIDINVNASYLTNTLNFALNTRHGGMALRNVPIPSAASETLAVYKPIEAYERVLNHYSNDQYLPYCTVDGNKVRSFSDRSYNYRLTRSWHVVLRNERPGHGEFVVLARRPSENKQEMYISYRSHTGKELEIEVQPAPEGQKNHAMNVKTNAKKISEGDLTTYWDDVDEKPILEYYNDENGVLIMNIGQKRLRVMYDGSRLVVMTYKNRMENRGICGYMSGDPRDDYLTPNGLIDEPEYYAASYVLIEADSDSKEKELHSQAKKMAYEPRKKYTAILRSDEEWQKSVHSSSEEEWGSQVIYRARNYLKNKESCELRPQVQYYENHGEICITTTALPACQSHCSGDDYKIQSAQVVCRPKLDQQFRSYRDQIRQGQNPRANGVPRPAQYRVPGSCSA